MQNKPRPWSAPNVGFHLLWVIGSPPQGMLAPRPSRQCRRVTSAASAALGVGRNSFADLRWIAEDVGLKHVPRRVYLSYGSRLRAWSAPRGSAQSSASIGSRLKDRVCHFVCPRRRRDFGTMTKRPRPRDEDAELIFCSSAGVISPLRRASSSALRDAAFARALSSGSNFSM